MFRNGSETIERLSRHPEGSAIVPLLGSTSISSDGSRIAFAGSGRAFVTHAQVGFVRPSGVAIDPDSDGDTSYAAISRNGERVVFLSTATNLVAGDTNGFADVFVHDLVYQTTQRVSIATDGSEADAPSEEPAISGDGRWVVFQSTARNLVPVRSPAEYALFLHDVETGTTVEVQLPSTEAAPSGRIFQPSLSYDGGVLVFESIFFGGAGVFAFEFE
jgi:Tol biopolymer transport system component